MGIEAMVVDSTALARDQATGTKSEITSVHVLFTAPLVPGSTEGFQNKIKLASETDGKWGKGEMRIEGEMRAELV